MKYTTLNQIGNYGLYSGVYSGGWIKLLESLNKTEADDEPLPFKHILDSNGIKDAIWALQVLPFKEQASFRADVAELSLHIFEEEYPEDKLPRLAIETLRKFAVGEATEEELKAVADYLADVTYLTTRDRGAAYIANAVCTVVSIDASTSASISAYAYSIDTAGWEKIEQLFIKHFCGE